MEHWGADFNSAMFTIIKYKFKSKLSAKYNNINIVRNDKPSTLSAFPTVQIPDPTKNNNSKADNLDMTTPESLIVMYQLETFAKTSDEAEMLANKLEEVMCEMQFKVTMSNQDMDSGTTDTYRRVGRYQRVIDKDDTI